MAFQLKSNEPICAGVVRNVRRQLEKILESSGTGAKPHATPANDAVFEVRKGFKKIRAAIRLVRDELGEDLYHEENFCLRDAARPLTEIRDATVLVEAADKLKPEIQPAPFAKIRKALVANQQEVTRRVLETNKAFATVRDVATRALGRLGSWKLTREGWPAVEAGVRRAYRGGRRALSRAAENPTVDNLHEWRKQSKYLWHQLQLLGNTLPEKEKELIEKTHQLGTILGEDHDLAVFRARLAVDPLTYGGHRALKDLFVIVDRHRQGFQLEAFALGRAIYLDPPKAFMGRIEASTTREAVR